MGRMLQCEELARCSKSLFWGGVQIMHNFVGSTGSPLRPGLKIKPPPSSRDSVLKYLDWSHCCIAVGLSVQRNIARNIKRLTVHVRPPRLLHAEPLPRVLPAEQQPSCTRSSSLVFGLEESSVGKLVELGTQGWKELGSKRLSINGL